MKRTHQNDLADLTDIMEALKKALSSMTLEDKIDVAARLKPVAKVCNSVDEEVKVLVKTKLKHKEGSVNGGSFKAVLALIDTTRLDQKLLKEEEPEIHAEYNKPVVDERVTFELR